MYPQDTGDFNAPSQKPYDDQQDTTKEIKYSGRRARKNRHTEDEDL
jgi:hypothetical protein